MGKGKASDGRVEWIMRGNGNGLVIPGGCFGNLISRASSLEGRGVGLAC